MTRSRGAVSGLVDEDTLEFPPAWKRLFHPRQGGVPVKSPVVAPDPVDAVRQLVEPVHHRVAESLDIADPPLAEAGRGYLAALLAGGPSPDASALAAAVFAAAVGKNVHHPARLRARTQAIADMWVAGRGMVFAAQATAALAGLVRSEYYPHRLYQEGVDDDPNLSNDVCSYHCEPIPRRLRRHLATAAVEQYRAVCAALCGYRNPTPRQRSVITYLIPTETHLFDETMDVFDRILAVQPAGRLFSGDFLTHSATTVAQVQRVLHQWAPWTLASAATLVDAVGPAIAPLVATWFDSESVSDRRQRHAGLLALLPSDEAFTLLLERAEHPDAQSALAQARTRFPNRAKRLG
jgi:hypothetical protein